MGLMPLIGTNLPIRNVRFHGESWRVSGRATEIAKATFMTPRRHCVPFNQTDAQKTNMVSIPQA